MESKRARSRLLMSRYKLDSLLDITRSINANANAEELLSKYEDILCSSLGIGKILIYMHSQNWEPLLNAGFTSRLETRVDPETDLVPYSETKIFTAEEERPFPEVDIIIPVHNNNQPLAYVLIGDIEEEGELMSPILKHLHFVQTISNIIIVAIENIRLLEETIKQETFKKEMELAAKMQSLLIPDNELLPHNKNIMVTGFYHPHYDVGGDYYDCIELDDGSTVICIADVSGKGISAALLMSNFQASFRALLSSGTELKTLVRSLNDVVIKNASGEKFITLFVARYHPDKRILEYINAAHNSPVLYDTVTGKFVYLDPSCVGIGMLDEMPSVSKSEIIIANMSKIVLYTDGLSELKDRHGNDIGTEAICRHIANNEAINVNITSLIDELGIPDNNPYLFDDVSILAATLF
ncbi:MAG: SpoIIE family protein phosphatase [Bacteroidales bacterium]